MEQDFLNGFGSAAFLAENCPTATRHAAIQRISWLASHSDPVVNDATEAGICAGMLAALGVEPSADLGFVQ